MRNWETASTRPATAINPSSNPDAGFHAHGAVAAPATTIPTVLTVSMLVEDSETLRRRVMTSRIAPQTAAATGSKAAPGERGGARTQDHEHAPESCQQSDGASPADALTEQGRGKRGGDQGAGEEQRDRGRELQGPETRDEQEHACDQESGEHTLSAQIPHPQRPESPVAHRQKRNHQEDEGAAQADQLADRKIGREPLEDRIVQGDEAAPEHHAGNAANGMVVGAGRHIAPIREARARRCRQRQGERESGRAGVLDSTSSTLAAFNAADAGRSASAAANR